ncbi:hypothetical protein V502_06179, partial [Pseudogymnoascus sp. VKM F-4520 (FW-2644)]
MAKRKTADSEIENGGERVTRRSTRVKSGREEVVVHEEEEVEPVKLVEATAAKATKVKGKARSVKDEVKGGDEEGGKITNTPIATNGATAAAAKVEREVAEEPPADRQYWLMKAEPESRLEKGHDVKFSIDDLASKTEPEAWDGIRSYAARNNLRAMKKGDLAFFYHSSCKTPAIVGVMEIVREHTPD